MGNGTYTLIRPIYPISYNNGGYTMDTGSNAAANMATNPGATMMYPGQQAAPDPNTPNNVPNPPEPKEGDKDNDSEDQIGESPEVQKENEAKGEKNKEIPMHPFTGPLSTSLSQQNISKSSRRKIKVLQPLESAAQGEELSIMSEANKIKRKKVLSRTLIHPKHEDIAAAKLAKKHHKKHHKKANVAPKVAAAATPVKAAAAPAPVAAPATPAATGASLASKLGKATKVEPQVQTQKFSNSTASNASPSLGVAESNEESGSGSGIQSEADTADIISDTDEEFWSK